jgi:hypothetical protein
VHNPAKFVGPWTIDVGCPRKRICSVTWPISAGSARVFDATTVFSRLEVVIPTRCRSRLMVTRRVRPSRIGKLIDVRQDVFLLITWKCASRVTNGKRKMSSCKVDSVLESFTAGGSVNSSLNESRKEELTVG